MNKKLILEKVILSSLISVTFYILAFYSFNIVDDAFINTINQINIETINKKDLADYKLYIYGGLGVFITIVLIISVWGVFSIMKRRESLFKRKKNNA